MLKTIDGRSKSPYYRQLKTCLESEIEEGNYRPHDLVPSENQLGRMYGVSVGTVKRALIDLVREGYLYRRQGRGTFVSDREERIKANPRLMKMIFFFPLLPSDFFIMELVQGIRHFISEHEPHYELSMEFVADRAELVQCLRSPLVKGLIVPVRKRSDLEPFSSTNLPLVALGHDCAGTKQGSVRIDNRQGGFRATEYLIQSGKRRIGCLDYSVPVNQERLAGYREALAVHGLSYEPALVVNSNWTVESGYLAARELMRQVPDLDAVFAPGYYMATGALRAVKEAGPDVSTRVAVIGFDYPDSQSVELLQFPTIKQPVKEMGASAAEMLTKMIEGIAVKEKSLVLPVDLLEPDT